MTAIGKSAESISIKSPKLALWRDDAWLAPRLVAGCLVLLLLSLYGEWTGFHHSALLLLNIAAYVTGGFYGAKSAISSVRDGEIDVDLLMLLAALGAALVGEWHEGATLLFLFSLSNALQEYAMDRSRRAITGLLALYPTEARIRRGTQEAKVRLDEIRLGDIVMIEPGERIPVDGVVVAGGSAVDESPITGESMPVDKTPGDAAFAGALNKHGSLDIRAERSAGQSTLSRIIKLVEEAQDSKAPTERYLQRFEQRYAKAILLIIFALIVVPPLLGTSDFESNFYRAMVLMTVASPCALVISVPATFISAIAAGARHGILFKGGASLQRMAEAKAVVFDKTGTLTLGEPRVTEVFPLPGTTQEALLAAAATAEMRSEHPLGKAVVDYARQLKVHFDAPDSFVALPGKGVRAQTHGQVIQVGRPAHLETATEMPASLAERQRQLEAAGKTVVAVKRDDAWLGLIALADEARPGAAATVAALKARGFATFMLTGDNARVAESVAASLGVDHVEAALLPHEKAELVAEIRRRYGAVLMVGDGINDAPALAAADVGIAMGGAGSDVALETADVALMGDKIERLDDAIQLSLRARRVVRQNVAFSLAVMALLSLGVFAIDLPLPLGVLGHEGSTVLVVLNGVGSLLLLPALKRRLA